jgi:NAD(P)-dependent dehydrogenase (short-subunit alcohol dehydrogenase family)
LSTYFHLLSEVIFQILTKNASYKFNSFIHLVVLPTTSLLFYLLHYSKNFFKNKKFKKLALGNIPMGKAATESDVATTVCFLASSASSMITGTSIIIDGGWTAQ